jgi:hypothetical protein
MLGETLDESERDQVRDYLHGLGIVDEMPLVDVSDWNAARRTISDPSWDRRWWDAEQAERKRLYAKASAALAQNELLASLSHLIEHMSEAVHGAAAVAAAAMPD